MRARTKLRTALACALTLCGSSAHAAEILGSRPGYLSSGPGPVPNQQAITRRIWAPGLDEGYVPQGLAVAEGVILLSAYRSADPKVGRGPCRVFRIDPRTGASTGFFDLPPGCGHAGGLAYLGKGSLVVADTRRLYRIDMPRAFADRTARDALRGTVRLGGEAKGSFAAFDGRDLWLGVYDKDEAKSRLYRFPLSIFEEFSGKGVLTEDRALAALPVPKEAQGAAFGPGGSLWTTSSGSRFGKLYKLHPKTGAVLASHEMAAGIEGIAFDGEGKLWSVSEAGSQRWSRWTTTFPIVFRVDVEKLR